MQGAPGGSSATRAFLTYVVVPAWLTAGLLDWMWHRRTKIEATSSAHESLTHVLMALEGGAGIAAGMLFETDAATIATMLAAALVHEATVVWDVGYTTSRRRIPQAEDHTHSFLEVIPFAAAAFAAFQHPNALRALPRLLARRSVPALRLNPEPLPRASLVALLAGGLLGVGPYAEELVRCLRVRPTLAPQPPNDPSR
ncbi:MAG TPA: hypothetical protein VGC96_13695 [Candidatus Elarobacter sp.]|jgi:hypothetical protein